MWLNSPSVINACTDNGQLQTTGICGRQAAGKRKAGADLYKQAAGLGKKLRANTGCICLLDLIYEVPRLLEVMHTKSLVGLSATSSATHQQVQAYVTGITGVHHTDFPCLVNQKRPLLNKLDLTDTQLHWHGMFLLLGGRWPVLTTLKLASNRLGSTTISVLIQADWPALTTLDLQMNCLGAVAIHYLSQANWPLLKDLNICASNMDVAAVEHLVTGAWPKLEHLHLSKNPLLSSAAASYLVKSHWPLLKTLALSGTQIGVTQLKSGGWPLLESLNLASTLAADVVQLIAQRYEWQNVKHLDLSSSRLGTQDFLQFVDNNWPALETLDISAILLEQALFLIIKGRSPPQPLFVSNLLLNAVCCCKPAGIAMCRVLVQAELPTLILLSLASNHLDAVAPKYLVKGNWSCIQHLDLSQNQLDGEAIAMLVQTNLRSLQVLLLDQNILDFWAVSQLVRGRWCLLRRLTLQTSHMNGRLTTAGTQQLLKGNWPFLESLELSVVDVTAAALFFTGSAEVEWCEGVGWLTGAFSNASEAWPFLKVVKIHSHCHIAIGGM